MEIAWLCDVDPAQIERMSKKVTDGFQAAAPKRTAHYEDVINDKNVDAVIIATPHHWHAPIAIMAMQAGKDCYFEKPISHVYNEGHAIIKASRKYDRIVQQGSQMRNSPVTLKADRLLNDGLIGEVKVAKAWKTLPNIKWSPVMPAETFSFYRCGIRACGNTAFLRGLVYWPHPSTKPEFHQDPSILEILSPYLDGVKYGSEVELELNSEEIAVID